MTGTVSFPNLLSPMKIGDLELKNRIIMSPVGTRLARDGKVTEALKQFYVVGYKGTSPYDSGLFYCPYVPLQMVRAVGQDSFQPKIGFKTRYGMVANPFAEAAPVDTAGSANSNKYYRRVQVTNIM